MTWSAWTRDLRQPLPKGSACEQVTELLARAPHGLPVGYIEERLGEGGRDALSDALHSGEVVFLFPGLVALTRESSQAPD